MHPIEEEEEVLIHQIHNQRMHWLFQNASSKHNRSGLRPPLSGL